MAIVKRINKDIDLSNVNSLLGINNIFNFILNSTDNVTIIKKIKRYGALSGLDKSIVISDNINTKSTKILEDKSIKNNLWDNNKFKSNTLNLIKTPAMTSYLQFNQTKNLSRFDNRINELYPTGEFSLGTERRKYEYI